jgi:hypothetical protein
MPSKVIIDKNLKYYLRDTFEFEINAHEFADKEKARGRLVKIVRSTRKVLSYRPYAIWRVYSTKGGQ